MKTRKPLPILIRHTLKDSFVRGYRMRSSDFTIGSSRFCDIRIYDKSVPGILCQFEFRNNQWIVMNLADCEETNVRLKIDGKSFVEHKLSNSCNLQIGNHFLDISIAKKPRELFEKSSYGEKARQKIRVVRWNGRVFEVTDTTDFVVPLKALIKAGVEVAEIEVPQQPIIENEAFTVDKEIKRPLIGSLLTLLVFLIVLVGIPTPKKEEEKPKDNVFTRMIYDNKVLAEKKKQLVGYSDMKIVSEGVKGRTTATSKAIQSLRQSGLQSIIGKIAIRASESAQLVAALTGTPSANAAPQSLSGLTAPTTGIKGNTGAPGNGKGFQIGGIGTGGKGGGSGGYKDGTGLGTGNAGNGFVGLEDEESVVEGGLDRDVIAAVIKEKLGQIRYCYERQLSANPELYGKVKVKFTIDGEGSVETQSIGQTTLNNALVEECILRRIATWMFPKPKGGTKVLVSYPFLFKSVQ